MHSIICPKRKSKKGCAYYEKYNDVSKRRTCRCFVPENIKDLKLTVTGRLKERDSILPGLLNKFIPPGIEKLVMDCRGSDKTNPKVVEKDTPRTVKYLTNPARAARLEKLKYLGINFDDFVDKDVTRYLEMLVKCPHLKDCTIRVGAQHQEKLDKMIEAAREPDGRGGSGNGGS